MEDDTEFRRNYVSFEYVNALYALNNGWTGAGVKVAVLDDGVKEVSELAGKISSLSRDYGSVTQNGVTTRRSVIGDDYSDHGTMVATVIAGANNGSGVQGIAPGAEIVALRISSINLDATNADDIETLGVGMSQAIAYAASQGIKVLNASISKADPTRASTTWQQAVATFQNAGGLFVNSAGNDAGANADGYLDLNSTNSQSWLFVVALAGTQTSYELASYSNQCGTAAMNNCVAAMGTNAAQAVDGSLVLFGGTSSSAPQVSGLAALILSKWPQLTGIQAGQVILNTARDIGATGVDPVFGHGLIDVQAALSPVNPTVSNGVVTSSVGTTSLVVPDAVNVSAIQTAALGDVTVLDAYGRDFQGNFGGLASKPGKDLAWLDRRIRVQSNAGSAAIDTPQLRASAGFTRLRTGPGADQMRTLMTNGSVEVRAGRTWLTASLNSTDSVADEFAGLAPSSDAVFAYSPLADMAVGARHPLGRGTLGVELVGGRAAYGSAHGAVVTWRQGGSSLKAGVLDERNVLFGTPTGSGALRFGDGARSLFIEASKRLQLGAWTLAGYASLGATKLRLADDMLLTHAGTMLTNRFGVTASRHALGGRISFGLAQPLVVLSGNGTYTVGSSYDLDSRSLLFSNRQVDFSGHIDPLLTFGYERGGPRSTLRLGLASNSAATDLRAVGSWRLVLR